MTLQQAVGEERVEQFLDQVYDEMEAAVDEHGEPSTHRHHFYAVLLEEVEELWDEIKQDGPSESLRKELVQVVGVCLNFIAAGGQ